MMQAKEYEDESVIWTPEVGRLSSIEPYFFHSPILLGMPHELSFLLQGNPSLVNQDKADALFTTEEKFRVVSVIFEANDDDILTVKAFEEMQKFEQLVYEVTEYSDTYVNDLQQIQRPEQGELFSFADVCQ